jgi:hypothetical protein
MTFCHILLDRLDKINSEDEIRQRSYILYFYINPDGVFSLDEDADADFPT